MENLALVSSPKVLSASCTNLSGLISIRCPFHPLPHLSPRRRRYGAGALSQGGNNDRAHPPLIDKSGLASFASISSSNSSETSSIGVNPQISVPPPPSHVGSPLFWIGVGVGLSALFSWVATYLKKYAMQQAFKTMLGQMSSESSKFNIAAFSPGSPFPFPASGTPSPVVSPSPACSQTAMTVDVPVTKVEAAPATEVKDNAEIKEEPKRYAFIDISAEEMLEKDHFEGSKESIETSSSKDAQITEEVYQNGAVSKQNTGVRDEQSQSTQNAGSLLSVEALEKMMEDPTVQNMVYPNNMGGSSDWDNQTMDSLKNFDLSSPEVKQQFDQIGLTPEEVISKIMANPDVAMAFQNPRVQAAIMDCSQNPLSIAKYQNDKEVMDVFNKISELFPGV